MALRFLDTTQRVAELRVSLVQEMTNHLMDLIASSEKFDWATSPEWFDYLDLEFGFYAEF